LGIALWPIYQVHPQETRERRRKRQLISLIQILFLALPIHQQEANPPREQSQVKSLIPEVYTEGFLSSTQDGRMSSNAH
jgi:hypothetical protein